MSAPSVEGHLRIRRDGSPVLVRPYRHRDKRPRSLRLFGMAFINGGLAAWLSGAIGFSEGRSFGTGIASMGIALLGADLIVYVVAPAAQSILRRSQAALPGTLVQLASLIGGGARHFRVEEWATDLFESPTPVRKALTLVIASLRMRAFDLAGWLRRMLCKLLSSEFRTWGVLVPIVVFAFSDVIQSEGWGVGFFTIPTVVLIYQGVGCLRERWGVTVKRRRARDDDSQDN